MKQKVTTYDRLIRQRARCLIELKELAQKSIIRGSIRLQGNRCGTKGCRCKRKSEPILHGPYPYLSFRGKRSNHSILLTKNKDIYAKEAIDNYKKLTNAVIELSEVDFQILRYYHKKLFKGA